MVDTAQAFPKRGRTMFKIDLEEPELTKRITKKSDDAVYGYVLTTVILKDLEFQQTGTAPNLQGGYITLCTCKHRMRASLSSDDWQDKWVAGFTSLKCDRRHWLFYLMRVQAAYPSHSELWHSREFASAVKDKSATKDQLGDVYEPKGNLENDACFDPNNYELPCAGHNHRVNACHNEWKTDIIDYRRKKLKRKAKNPSSLLVGDPKLSFLWQKGKLYIKGNFRTKKWDRLSDFLTDLNTR